MRRQLKFTIEQLPDENLRQVLENLTLLEVYQSLGSLSFPFIAERFPLDFNEDNVVLLGILADDGHDEFARGIFEYWQTEHEDNFDIDFIDYATSRESMDALQFYLEQTNLSTIVDVLCQTRNFDFVPRVIELTVFDYDTRDSIQEELFHWLYDLVRNGIDPDSLSILIDCYRDEVDREAELEQDMEQASNIREFGRERLQGLASLAAMSGDEDLVLEFLRQEILSLNSLAAEVAMSPNSRLLDLLILMGAENGYQLLMKAVRNLRPENVEVILENIPDLEVTRYIHILTNEMNYQRPDLIERVQQVLRILYDHVGVNLSSRSRSRSRTRS